MLIAIDGPAASGKGTIARKIATKYDLPYLDTGSIYRAVGFLVMQSGNYLSDIKALTEIANNIKIEDTKNTHPYDEGVGGMASKIATIPEVRNALLNFQKNFASNKKGAILDGRDIGTVICPNADFKFYITADIETRATRRFKQLQKNDNSVIYESVLKDLMLRDERDSGRKVSPLKRANDSTFINTTNLSVDEVVEFIVNNIENN